MPIYPFMRVNGIGYFELLKLIFRIVRSKKYPEGSVRINSNLRLGF